MHDEHKDSKGDHDNNETGKNEVTESGSLKERVKSHLDSDLVKLQKFFSIKISVF